MFSRFGLFSVAVLFLSSGLFAQSFSEFKRTQVGSFETFKEKKDQLFHTYLKEQWKEYEAYTTPNFYKKQKPKNIEAVVQRKPKPIGPIVDIVVEKEKEQKPKKLDISVTNQEFVFNFFGTQLGFDIEKKVKELRFYPKNQNGIISFFAGLASSDYETTIYKIKEISKEMQLNDWGVYQLVKMLSKEIYRSPDEAKLFRWFMLNKLSYDVKIALAQNHVVLLQNTQQVVYSTPRYKINGAYYYALEYANSNERIGHLYTYDKKYPKGDKKLDFRISKTPFFQELQTKRKLRFQGLGQTYTFNIELNKNLVGFLGTYPQVDYDVYFNAPMEYTLYEELAKQIRVYINGKKASQGLNFVLHFVQNSFKYQRDNEQFGKNKVMFAEETLFYESSDCEDRAVLFAKLVRKLFHFGVVGVKYKDHMSTALYIPMDGDSIKMGSKRYVIADPTYINANIGMNMPKYKNIQPESFVKLQ
ncbi:MAG: hypothetical protein ABXS93_06450 [Sulfurimonas sp.]